MTLSAVGALAKDGIFLYSRGSGAANGLQNGSATGVTNGVRSVVKSVETLDSASKVSGTVKIGLKNVSETLAGKTSKSTFNKIAKGAGVLKGAGLAANVLHAGGIAIDESKKSGSAVDGAIIGSSAVSGMYIAEKASLKAYDKVMPKVLNFLGKSKLPKGMNTILKTSLFIVASFIGTDAGLAAGKFISKN